VSLSFIGVILYNLRIKPNEINHKLLYISLINAVAVIFQIIFPNSLSIFAKLVQYSKVLFPLRGFGLAGSYDGSGFICALGLSISYLQYYYRPKKTYIITSLIFLVAIFFTGRTGMIIGTLVSVTFFIIKLYSLSSLKKYLYTIPLLLFISFIVFSIYNIINITLYVDDIASMAYVEDIPLADTYASQTPDVWYKMWVLPIEIHEIIFGTGASNPAIDIGYVNIIHMYGFIGLLFTVIYYYYIFKKTNYLNKCIKVKKMSYLTDYLITSKFLKINIILTIIYNLKHMFYFSRNYSEMIFAVFFIMLTHLNSINRKVSLE
tara:strand:+ start:81 stop:1037 length:957 start_codon:yes stop_codon:yes gene_type:complete